MLSWLNDTLSRRSSLCRCATLLCLPTMSVSGMEQCTDHKCKRELPEESATEQRERGMWTTPWRAVVDGNVASNESQTVACKSKRRRLQRRMFEDGDYQFECACGTFEDIGLTFGDAAPFTCFSPTQYLKTFRPRCRSCGEVFVRVW